MTVQNGVLVCYRKDSNPRLEYLFSKCYLFREFYFLYGLFLKFL